MPSRDPELNKPIDIPRETIAEYFKKNPEELEKWNVGMTAFRENFLQMIAPMQEAMKVIQEQNTSWQRQWQTSMEAASNVLNEFSGRLEKEPQSLRFLADHGWYLRYDMGGPISDLIRATRYADLIKSGNVSMVDKEMSTQIDQTINETQEQLCSRFPARTKQISAAIRAHQKKEYYLSVPVFFSLIEGICEDLTGGTRFFKTSGKRTTMRWVKEMEAMEATQGLTVLSVIMEPLRHLGVARQIQGKIPNGLNRHDVLHGTSTDYGEDPLNSYKALSLLSYIGLSLQEWKQLASEQS